MSGEIDQGANDTEKDASVTSGDMEKPKAATKAIPASATGKNNEDESKMSKNQLKKKRKREKMLEFKKRRKEQQKNVKIAKAKAEGRDIAALKVEMERRRLDGSGWARRNERWQEIFKNQSSKYQVYVDCSFEEAMTQSEINSLASQIRYCYAVNKKAKHPVKVTACSLGGETLDILKDVSGFDKWEHRAFYQTDRDIIEASDDKSKLVYLTSDSENTLSGLEDDKIYIIGGIVDRNRLKRVAIDRAEKFGIKTAKLPITDYLNMVSTKVLTCNHVFEILLKWTENDGDWKKALLDVLPKKKDAMEKTP